MMSRKTVVAFLVLASSSAGWAAENAITAHDVTLKSVSVTFPSNSRLFPEGPNVDTVNANCVTCHSAGMVLTQPPLSKAVWNEEVTKMRKVYGAPVAEADVPAIVDYLAMLKPAP